jgi:hypothetical protein
LRDGSTHTAAGLAGITTLPDHGDDGAAEHVCFCQFVLHARFLTIRTCDETLEERLVGQV